MQHVEDGSTSAGPSSTHRAEERRQLFAARREMRQWQEELRAEARALPWPPDPCNGDADRFFPMKHYIENVDGRIIFRTVKLGTRADRALMRVALTQAVQDRKLAECMRGRYIAIYGR